MSKPQLFRGNLFELEGVPPLRRALPLAVQHVVAMIVGCVTPAIIVSGSAGLPANEQVILIQAALVISALSTLLQLFPLGRRLPLGLGSGLPVIMGVSFAYVPTMQAIAEGYGVAAILGAQIVGGAVAVLVGLFVKKLRRLFPPLITGTVVFTIGLSLYPTAINYMAGGVGSVGYGSWQNWLVALFTLAVVTALNHYGKGLWKLSSILLGIGAGYALSACFGMVNFQSVGEAAVFQLPQLLYFGIDFEISACVAIGILFGINAVQAIGDLTATTVGAMEREPTDRELQNGIVGYGVMNMIGGLFGGLPTATYSQNVGIVTTTKVINRVVLGLSALILGLAGLIPKFSALLTTIPQCVLGGATVSVFASIAMTGMKLVSSAEMDYRNSSIVGLAAALGMGISQASSALSSFPEWVTTIFGKSPVVVATLVAVVLNVILPKNHSQKKP
ncbi:MAG TPA: purine permease [Candidatus Avoscillospira avicola]|uniref:Purine permease n=1 Tax=Candidatus Avoscillospira avicola TaxID=2840706 RepID=A0A9D1IX44_9FIRM|nr:purine permease [Candidatus Avoscillospira avicola]